MKKTLLKTSFLSTLLLCAVVEARELKGFSNLLFGMKFDDAKALVQHKPDFEVWQQTQGGDDHLKYTVILSGLPMTARAFFKNGIAESFSVSTYHSVSSEQQCIDTYLDFITDIEKRYGKVTNPAVSEGIFYKADFGFSNQRHINLSGNYDGIINKCLIRITYENSPLTRKMPPINGTVTTEDNF